MTKTDQDRVDFETFGRLLVTAKLLYANAEGCAVNHYGADFEIHGVPGWLAGCRADIEAAQTALAHERARAQGEPVAVQDTVTVDKAWRDLCDKDDRTSIDYPGFALIRQDELATYMLAASPVAPPAESGEVDGLEEAVRLAEVGEYLFIACRHSGGNGYTEPREMAIEWQWQQSAPDQYGEGMLLAAATKWHDEQAEDDIVTEARKLRASIASHTPAQPSEPAKAEVVDAALWCAHVRGPDDVAAAASYDDAVALCDQINAIAKAYAHLDVMVVAYPALWPWDAQSHAANLAKGNGYRGPTLATTPTAPATARSAAEAKMHAVNLEQCSIFVESEPIKRAMTDAAAFIRASLPGEEA